MLQYNDTAGEYRVSVRNHFITANSITIAGPSTVDFVNVTFPFFFTKQILLCSS